MRLTSPGEAAAAAARSFSGPLFSRPLKGCRWLSSAAVLGFVPDFSPAAPQQTPLPSHFPSPTLAQHHWEWEPAQCPHPDPRRGGHGGFLEIWGHQPPSQLLSVSATKKDPPSKATGCLQPICSPQKRQNLSPRGKSLRVICPTLEIITAAGITAQGEGREDS